MDTSALSRDLPTVSYAVESLVENEQTDDVQPFPQVTPRLTGPQQFLHLSITLLLRLLQYQKYLSEAYKLTLRWRTLVRHFTQVRAAERSLTLA